MTVAVVTGAGTAIATTGAMTTESGAEAASAVALAGSPKPGSEPTGLAAMGLGDGRPAPGELEAEGLATAEAAVCKAMLGAMVPPQVVQKRWVLGLLAPQCAQTEGAVDVGPAAGGSDARASVSGASRTSSNPNVKMGASGREARRLIEGGTSDREPTVPGGGDTLGEGCATRPRGGVGVA